MAWCLAFCFVLTVGFVYDHDVAQYLPLTDVALRQTMIGASFGLVVGFAIHSFRRRV